MDFDVVGVGTVLLDHQVTLDQFPDPDTKVPLRGHRVQIGGPVPAALVMLTRLGRTCGFLGSWGGDRAGRRIGADLAREGVDTALCQVREEAETGFAHVWVDAATGARTVAYWRGTAAAPGPSEVPQLSAKVLHLDGWAGEAALVAAQRMRARGGRVVLDAGAPKEKTAELLPFVDLMTVPERFPQEFAATKHLRTTEDVAAALLELGVGALVFTNGAEGCWYVDRDHAFQQAAFAVDAVDTTGAGDVFAGALIHGLLASWAPREMVAFAAATAALKCQAIGNREALPSGEAVRALVSAQTA